MCKYCENGQPSGAGLEADDMASACSEQLAESLRDAIRSLGHTVSNDYVLYVEIDRCIDELVRRSK